MYTGSFNFSHNRPAFSIKQKDRAILDLIGTYIENILLLEYCTSLNRNSCATQSGVESDAPSAPTVIFAQQCVAEAVFRA